MIQKSKCEYIRVQAKQKFDQVRGTWEDLGKWTLPHRTRWLRQQREGERHNHHIVDPTHILSLRSYVAGFLEGNTSATRPWYRIGTGNQEKNMIPENHAWLDFFTNRTLSVLASTNFYHAAGQFYYDYGTFNTGAHYIDQMGNGNLFFHSLTPGAYYVINNGYGEAVVLVREFSMPVKALVDTYGQKVNGKWDWSNFSTRVKNLYNEGNYTQHVNVVHIVKENDDYDTDLEVAGENRKWLSLTYEVGSESGVYYSDGQQFGHHTDKDNDKYLKISLSQRKPFIIGNSTSQTGFEYGEKGPTLDALGLIKSLNKKAISKDQALEKMLRPPVQGPAALKRSYLSASAGSYIPLDATSASQNGLRTVYQVDPRIAGLIQDVGDLRQQVDKLYYADFLLYLSQNPKTRTATETDAVIQEQKMVIGPNLQSLNWTYNVPVVEFVMDYVLENDPYLPEPPEDLTGEFLRPEFISVFAQAQRAADLPQVEKYVAEMMNLAQIDPAVRDKVNLDKLADIYEDRLYLPAGAQAEAKREQAAMQQQRQQQLEAMSQMAGAAKDVGLQVNQGGPQSA